MGRAPANRRVELIKQIADIDGVTIIGLLTHAGHAYGAVSNE